MVLVPIDILVRANQHSNGQNYCGTHRRTRTADRPLANEKIELKDEAAPELVQSAREC